MADNTTYTPGSGATIAADDIGSGVLAQRVKPVWGPDGTGTDVDVASGLPVQSGWKEFTGSASANNTDLVSQDVSQYRWVSVQFSGTWSASPGFQQSNDGVTWFSISLLGTGGALAASAPNSNLMYSGAICARYFRVRTLSYTSGTVVATVELSAMPSASTFPTTAVTFGASAQSDNVSSQSSFAGQPLFYNGSSWDRQRTPTTFKSATATSSGNTALWTPTSGKKFRLMRYKVDVSQDAAQSSGGVITIGLQDNTTDVGLSQSVFVPGTAATAMGSGWTSGWIDLGNGKLSATINNVLNINLSAALTSGTCRVVACGTEE